MLPFVLLSFLALLASAIPLGVATPVPDGSILLPLNRIVNKTAYGINVAVGTPPQNMTVLIDTGSSMTGLQGTRSNWCTEKDHPCKEYGSYNNLTSSTAVWINDKFSNGLINHGFGSLISDTMYLGGKTVRKVDVGMITEYGATYPAPNPNSGLIGLIPLCKNANCSKYYETTLLEMLFRKSVVRNNILGIYLGPEHPNAIGSLAFGAIDKAKQRGPVAKLKPINPTLPIANSSPNVFNYSSMAVRTTTESVNSLAMNGVNIQKFPISKAAYTLLDTGNPILYLPNHVYDYVKQRLHLHGSSNIDGAYPVDCKYRTPMSDNPALLIGFNNDALKIEIPFNTLITQRTPKRCVAAVASCGSENGIGCPFGAPFFRSVYAAFNFDHLTLELSNVKYTNETKLVVPPM